MAALDAVSSGITEANKRARGEFDGLFGSLPKGSSELLTGIVVYLRGYLLDERKLSEAKVRSLLSRNLPRIHKAGKGFRSVPQEPEDSGICVAIGVLDSVLSALRLSDGRVKLGRTVLSAEDAIAILVSGHDGLRGMKVRAGGAHRGSDTRLKLKAQAAVYKEMQQAIDRAFHLRPSDGFKKLAERVALEFGCSERTIRRHTKNPRT